MLATGATRTVCGFVPSSGLDCARRRSARRRPATRTLPVTFAVHGRSHATPTATAKVVRKRCGVRAVAVSASRSLPVLRGVAARRRARISEALDAVVVDVGDVERPAAVDREVERMRELAGAAAHAAADPRAKAPPVKRCTLERLQSAT